MSHRWQRALHFPCETVDFYTVLSIISFRTRNSLRSVRRCLTGNSIPKRPFMLLETPPRRGGKGKVSYSISSSEQDRHPSCSVGSCLFFLYAKQPTAGEFVMNASLRFTVLIVSDIHVCVLLLAIGHQGKRHGRGNGRGKAKGGTTPPPNVR